jgi:hypothetical protein
MNNEVIPVNAPENLTIEENGFGIPVAAPIIMDDVADSDTSTAATKAAEVNAAFTAQPFFWKDIQLAPFAIDREADWLRHREVLFEPELNDLIQQPNAMMTDVCRVLWFLSHDPQEWLAMPGMKQLGEEHDFRWVRLTSHERALALEMKIRQWAAKHIHHSEGITALNLFYAIYTRAQATRATALPHETHDAQRAKK